MAITCPNKSLQSWKDLVAVQGEKLAYYYWNKHNGAVPQEVYQSINVGGHPLFQLSSSVSSAADKKLDAVLLDFLAPFGVVSRQIDDFKERFGVDSLGAADVLNKVIYYASDRKEDTVPEEAAHMITMLAGPNHAIIRQLMKIVATWEDYQSIYDEYMPQYKNENQVKFEAVGKLISKALVEEWKSSNIDKSSLLNKIKALIRQILNKLFHEMRKVSSEHQDLATQLARAVIAGDRAFIGSRIVKEKLDYEKAIKNNPLAAKIIDDITTDLDGKIVGSLAIAGQDEIIYRSSDEPIHDLDFTVENYSKDYLDKYMASKNAIPLHSGWANINKNYVTYSYLVPTPGHSVEANGFSGNKLWVSQVEIKDASGKTVFFGKPADAPRNVLLSVDFFTYPEGMKNTRESTIGNFASWQDIFVGKLTLSSDGDKERFFQREKDQQDYINTEPKNRGRIREQMLYFQLKDGEKDKWEEEHSKQTSIWNGLGLIAKSVQKLTSADGESDDYSFNGKKIKTRVSDIIKKLTGNKDFVETPERLFVKKYGIAVHADKESIINRYIDKDGFIRTDEGGNLAPLDRGDIATTVEHYDVMEKWLHDMFQEYVSNEETKGVRVKAETVIYQESKDTAGTIDLLVIHPSGKVDMLDWKSYNLNKEKYNDVPWYKTRHVNLQLGEYRRILQDVYGVKDLGRMRGIPIAMGVRQHKGTGKFRITSFEVGKYNAKEETRAYVLPIPTQDERTGIPSIDKLIDKAQALMQVLDEIRHSQHKKDLAKETEINNLLSAIRMLQTKQDVVPMTDFIQNVTKQAQEFVDNYKATLEAGTATLTEEEKTAYAKRIQELVDRFKPFEGISSNLHELFKEDEALDTKLTLVNEHMERAKGVLYEVYADFTDKYIGRERGIKYLRDAELPVSGYSKIINSPSAGDTRALALFSKIAAETEGLIQMRKEEHTSRVKKLEDALRKENPEGKNLFQYILRKDDNGDYIHERIDTIDSEFFKQLEAKTDEYQKANYKQKKKIGEEIKKWIEDNIDVKAYEAYAAKELAEYLTEIPNQQYSTDDKENEEIRARKIQEAKDRYDLSDRQFPTGIELSPAWFNYYGLKQFPLKSWESAEYKELQNHPASLAFYHYIEERVNKAKEVGFYKGWESRTFIPYLKAMGIAAKIGRLRTITPKNETEGTYEIDPLTEERVYRLPASTTYAIENTADIDKDLFQTMLAFDSQLIDFEYKNAIYPQIEAVIAVEERKGSIRPNKNSDAFRDEDGNLEILNNNLRNSSILKDAVAISWFAQRDLDGTAGKVLWKWSDKIDKMTGALDKTLGTTVFSTHLEGKVVTTGAVIEGGTNMFRGKALALNVTTSVSNAVGGRIQAQINRGIHWNRKDDVWSNVTILGIGARDKNSVRWGEMLDALVPYADNLEHERQKRVGNWISHLSIMDVTMATHKWADRHVQLYIALSMYKNAVVVDGKLVNARSYVRKKYADRYNTPTALKATEQQIEKEIEELQKTSGLIHLSTNVEDKWTFPVDDRQLANYRKLVVGQIRQATGQMTREDRNQITAMMWGRSFMTFKNWIPPLFSNRIKGIKYNPATETLQWGRFRTFGAALSKASYWRIGMIKDMIVANERGVEQMRIILKEKSEKYEKETGQKWEFSEAEFMDMMRNNLKAQWQELAYLVGLVVMTIGLRQLMPPDDDKDKKSRGEWALLTRQGHKIVQEISFFYNPLDIQQMANGQIVPALGALTDVTRFLGSVGKEIFGDSDKAYPLKNGMKMFPILNQVNTYWAYFSEDYAKAMGVNVGAQNTFIK